MKEYVPAEELLAVGLLKGDVELDTSMFKGEDYKLHPADRKQRSTIDRAFNGLHRYTRRPPTFPLYPPRCSHLDRRLYVLRGHRQLTTLNKVFNAVAVEHELIDFSHPFHNLY